MVPPTFGECPLTSFALATALLSGCHRLKIADNGMNGIETLNYCIFSNLYPILYRAVAVGLQHYMTAQQQHSRDYAFSCLTSTTTITLRFYWTNNNQIKSFIILAVIRRSV